MGCRNGKTSNQKTLEWEHAHTIFLDNRPVKTWFFLLLEVFERFSFCKGCVISKVGQGTKSSFFSCVVWGRLKDIGLGGIKWELYGEKKNNDQEGNPQVVKEHDGAKETRRAIAER